MATARKTPTKKAATTAREYPKGSGIVLREIPNRTGGKDYGTSYRVEVPAKLTGRDRERKQFKDKDAAEIWAEERFKGTIAHGASFFTLTDRERSDAVAAFNILRPLGVDLLDAVKFAAARMVPEGGIRKFSEVLDEILASKEERFTMGSLRPTTIRDFRVRVGVLRKDLGDRPVTEITGDDVKAWLLAFRKTGKKARSVKNYRVLFGEVFSYAMQRRYLTANPLDSFTKEDDKLFSAAHTEKEPSILTVAEARNLLSTAEANADLNLLPAVTLGLFCGLRTEEIKRLDWSEVHLDSSKPFVSIPASKAKKRRIRTVEIPGNALEWLALCPARLGAVAPAKSESDYSTRFRKLTTLAGFTAPNPDGGKAKSTWQTNAMRHSFGSYHYAAHGDPLETSRLLGHKASDDVLFAHYRALATEEDGKAFFALRPGDETGDVTPFEAAGT